MLEGFTEEKLAQYAEECQSRFTGLELDLMKEVLTGAIHTYKKLIGELETLNSRYEDEMGDYMEGVAPDIIECVIEDFKNDENNDKSLVSAVKDWLDTMSIVDKSTQKLVYMNEDGQICDEYGIPLSIDEEHRVFDIVRGGKFGKQTECALHTNMKVTKGGKTES